MIKSTLQLCALLLSALCTTPAFAGNEGPQAAPASPNPPNSPAPLARLDFAAGFMAAPNSFFTIEITADGHVDVERGVEKTRSTLIQLSVLETQKLTKSVAKIQPGKLVDRNPKQPSCEDAPTTTYFAINRGRSLEIAQEAGCKLSTKNNATSADRDVIALLDASLALVHQSPDPKDVVAQIESGGWMPVPGQACGSRTVRVYHSGLVIQTDCEKNPVLLGVVSANWIKFVTQHAQGLKPSPFVKLDPNAPEAADAGISVDDVIQADGTVIEIGGTQEMTPMVRASHKTDGTDSLVAAFKALHDQIYGQ